jgi:hypothetical protein
MKIRLEKIFYNNTFVLISIKNKKLPKTTQFRIDIRRF